MGHVAATLDIFAAFASRSPYLCMATKTKNQSEIELLRAHEGLIRYIAKPFASSVDMDDLMQEGRIALLGACRTYRPDHGVQLGTYAYKFVLGAMRRLARRELVEPARLHGAEHAFAHLDLEEVPAELVSCRLTSADPSPEMAAEAKQCQAIVSPQLSGLSEDERRVLRRRFIQEESFVDIAEQLGMSNDKAERVYRRAIVKLRSSVEARL